MCCVYEVWCSYTVPAFCGHNKNSNKEREWFEGLKLGELSIQRSTSIKNLGVTFDDSLTMYSQINTICKSVNFHIRNIWRIRRLSPLRHATTSLEDWSFPALTMPTLYVLARARLTLLVYNACKTRLRGWSCLADVTSPLLTCSGSYTGSLLNKESLTNTCCIFTKLYMIWLLVKFLPWHISRTLILLNIGNDCNPLQIRPGWLFPDLSNVPVTWALLLPLLASGMIFLFITVLAYFQEAAENSLVPIIFVLYFSCFFFCKALRSSWGAI